MASLSCHGALLTANFAADGRVNGGALEDDPNDAADPHGSFACFFDARGNLLGPKAHVKAMCT